MFKLLITLLFTGTIMASETIEKYKNEIMATEIAFNKMATKDGMKAAFLFFADENAVLKRGETLIKGKPAIAQYFDDNPVNFKTFTWLPDFIDVSNTGDMAYTYGPYQYEILGKKGELKKGRGTFHTVWKKQKDGQWRYVWD